MSDTLLLCDNLQRFYGKGKSEVKALAGVSFSIQKGECVAIIGASGSGKSTLLQLLGCLDMPTGGRLELDHHDVTQLSDDALSELRGGKIGFVFQAFHLFPRMTLLENVALPLFYQGCSRKEREQRAYEALERVRLNHRVKHKPHELSGGEKQRGAIARAIVHNPELILADEPTGNLDSVVKTEILEHLSLLNKEFGITVVMVTHDEETAQIARRHLHIRDGLLVNDTLCKQGES